MENGILHENVGYKETMERIDGRTDGNKLPQIVPCKLSSHCRQADMADAVSRERVVSAQLRWNERMNGNSYPDAYRVGF